MHPFITATPYRTYDLHNYDLNYRPPPQVCRINPRFPSTNYPYQHPCPCVFFVLFFCFFCSENSGSSLQWLIRGVGVDRVDHTPPLVAKFCVCSNSNFSPTGAITPPPLSGPPWPSPPFRKSCIRACTSQKYHKK